MVSIEDIISRYDVISFDIFDTLLLRCYRKPSDIWEAVEEESGCVGFAKARANADSIAYHAAIKRNSDAKLDDIYSIMPQGMNLKEEELEYERKSLFVNPTIADVWEKAGSMGKKRVIISDMYLPSDFLEEVLIQNGIKGWDGFYVSCERGTRKSTGGLYRIMLSEMGVEPQRVLHIGDNLESDGVQARKLGIETHIVPKVVDSFIDENAWLKEFLKCNNSLCARHLVGSLAIASNELSHVSGIDYRHSFEKFGALLGGVLAAGSVDMIVKEACEQRLNRLVFVARDGYVLEKILNKVAPEIKTQYVYAPRCVVESKDFDVVREYKRYVESLGLCSGKVGVVDGVSMHFSAQRLLEEMSGVKLFGFYIVAFSRLGWGGGRAFISVPNRHLGWQHMVEFLFSAPHAPVENVRDGKPVYISKINEDERYKISVYPRVANSLIETATRLLKYGVTLTPEVWLDYIESYIRNMPEEDREVIDGLRNAVDAKHSIYEPLLFTPKQWVVCTKKKIPYKLSHFERVGLKMKRTDYLFGFLRKTSYIDL